MFITPSFLLIALAIYTTIILIPALIYPKKFIKALSKLTKSESNIRIIGMHILTIAFFFLSVHWKFTGRWFMVIPILGWIFFVNGFLYLIFPKTIRKCIKSTILKSERKLILISFLNLLLAIGITHIALYIY